MPRSEFSAKTIPKFEDAPPVILVSAQVDFFVEENAAAVVDRLAGSDTEVLRFEDEATPDSIADALLHRSLFSPRRVVQLDVTGMLGTESPGQLLGQSVEAWAKGTPAGRREAFRSARAVLSALGLARADPAETAAAAAKKTRRKEDAAAFADVLRELPEEKGGGGGLAAAIRLLLRRGNEGTVALLTATAPPTGSGLVADIERDGTHLFAPAVKDYGDALIRLARSRAKEREVSIDPDAIQRLLIRTDRSPAIFSSELDKLLEGAGSGGRITAAEVRENVEDAASEDVYAFYDALGRRDAADALNRLARLFSDRPVRMGEREVDTDDYWPVKFLGMVSSEIRHMLLVRSALAGPGAPRFHSGMPYPEFQARILPRLAEPVAPFGRSPFAAASGQVNGYIWFKAAQRASRYELDELARTLSRAAEVDVQLKNSTPPLDAFTAWIAELVAGA
ncbi:MAG: hypothetical protein ABI592_03510 [Acidobacteriota bacterium]